MEILHYIRILMHFHLDMDTILTFIRKETVSTIGINKRKPRFDFHNPYNMDSCILLILTLLLYKLKDGE